jgi:hypothetical protein
MSSLCSSSPLQLTHQRGSTVRRMFCCVLNVLLWISAFHVMGMVWTEQWTLRIHSYRILCFEYLFGSTCWGSSCPRCSNVYARFSNPPFSPHFDRPQADVGRALRYWNRTCDAPWCKFFPWGLRLIHHDYDDGFWAEPGEIRMWSLLLDLTLRLYLYDHQ